MYDPIMRALTVLEILQARDHVTGSELAERLEVDLRTVQRYIVRLKDLKIPVESSRGVGGAYRLKPGYRLPPLLLTNEEAFALSLGLRALRRWACQPLRRRRRARWRSWGVCCRRHCARALRRWKMLWRSSRGRGW
ncbi:MAG TPA: HTH domain-containing protein [Terracidiphilus sp.]|nr:HTH domain-containing protein [Terracidiphilus sp.]